MKKLFIISVSLLVLFILDRASKILAVAYLKNSEPLSYLGGLFKLVYFENSGAMLSLGESLPDIFRFLIFTVLVGIALLAALAYIIVKKLHPYELACGILFIGGGLGNLFDRAMQNGAVVDFMLIDLGFVRTGVFNVADIAIMAGAIGFIFISTRYGRRLMDRDQTSP